MTTNAAAISRPRSRSRTVLRVADRAATVLCVLAVTAVAVVGVGALLGYSLLVDHSDSMRPALSAGDIVVSEHVQARALHRGDIATFPDRTRHGELVTHRVVAARADGSRIDFTTRGDANPASETWSVPAGSQVGRMAAHVPEAGYAIALVSGPAGRLLLLSIAAILLGFVAIRRIWEL